MFSEKFFEGVGHVFYGLPEEGPFGGEGSAVSALGAELVPCGDVGYGVGPLFLAASEAGADGWVSGGLVEADFDLFDAVLLGGVCLADEPVGFVAAFESNCGSHRYTLG